MSTKMRYIVGITLVGIILRMGSVQAEELKEMKKEIVLPQPKVTGQVSLEETISQRRSKRKFSSQQLTLGQISQLLWSAQGITDQRQGYRSAPSAGALYPMEIYLLSKDGLFHYLPQGHKLERLQQQDIRRELAAASLGQGFLQQAPINIVITAVYGRITSQYGTRGRRYTEIEVGHIAQNVHLQAVALGLSSVPVGAFDDQNVKELLKLPEEEEPLYIIPVGYPK